MTAFCWPSSSSVEQHKCLEENKKNCSFQPGNALLLPLPFFTSIGQCNWQLCKIANPAYKSLFLALLKMWFFPLALKTREILLEFRASREMENICCSCPVVQQNGNCIQNKIQSSHYEGIILIKMCQQHPIFPLELSFTWEIPYFKIRFSGELMAIWRWFSSSSKILAL